MGSPSKKPKVVGKKTTTPKAKISVKKPKVVGKKTTTPKKPKTKVKISVKKPKTNVKKPKVKVSVKKPKTNVKKPKVKAKVTIKGKGKKPNSKKKTKKVKISIKKKKALANKVDLKTYLDGTVCESQLDVLIEDNQNVKKYAAWYNTAYMTCMKAVWKFKGQATCAVCDGRNAQKFKDKVNFKDITPVMMACVPVMHFQEQVLGKSVSAWWDLLKAAKIAPKDLKFDHYMQVQAGKDFDKSECIKQKGTKSTKVKVSVKHKRILQSVAPKKDTKA